MADGKVLSDSTRKFLANVLDDLIHAGIAEVVDGMMITIVLNIIDKQADKFIPDAIDSRLDEIALLCGEKKWVEAAEKAAILADEKIDVPYLDDEMERKAFVSVATTIVSLVELWISKKKKE